MTLEPKEVIKKYFAENPRPARVIIDIIGYPDRVGLRLYRDDFNSIPDSQQLSILEWMEKTLKDLNHQNDFIVTIEMEAKANDV